MFCECNNQCCKKDGKNRGCPCKTRNVKCTELCKCGKKTKKGVILLGCKNGGPNQPVKIPVVTRVSTFKFKNLDVNLFCKNNAKE